jgi:hypothetical protein
MQQLEEEVKEKLTLDDSIEMEDTETGVELEVK